MRNTLFCLLMLSSFLAAGAHAQTHQKKLTPQMLAGDAQFLGEYEVKQESSKFHKNTGDLCIDPTDEHGLSCGDRIWVYQGKDSQLIFINEVLKENIEADEPLMVWTLEGTQCEANADIKDARSKGIANLGLCSAKKDSAKDPGDADQFSSNRPASGLAGAIDLISGGYALGVVPGGHTTHIAVTDPNTILVNDVWSTLKIDDLLVLKRLSN